jgi:cytochrome c-type biogenesis protein CcmH
MSVMAFFNNTKWRLSILPTRTRLQSLPNTPLRGRGTGEGETIHSRISVIGALFVSFLLLVPSAIVAIAPPDLEEQTRAIATELRCVVCQNLSVADSPSEMAQQMRAVVREQLQAGKTPEQVKEFFVSKYGEWVLLKPKNTGFSALLWILPYVALVLGVVTALWFIRRWARAKKFRALGVDSNEAARSELLKEDFARPDLEDSSPRAALLRERARLQDEIRELEFDFQSGKLSDSDRIEIKQEIEAKAAAVMEQLRALPPEAPPIEAARKIATRGSADRTRLRRWQIVTGGVFLMLFGLALGVMLTQSIRPRLSENDTMTGDFMTGTTAASGDLQGAMNEGKQAFARQEFPKAIEAFKKVLSADPDNPVAHSYMGYILLQAGHGDGALMAFDKALSQAPDLPMALWGKGMVLYQDKKDFVSARGIFERLLSLVPPGEERNEIAKVLAEMPAGDQKRADSEPSAAAAGPSSTAQISGKITIDPKLKAKLDPNAALFIIARPAGTAAGPPLAVKKIDRPKFPLDYSLSQDNVMMQGTRFAGKITISVRLDKDGNPGTRGAGDLSGEYAKNPVEVGANSVDIVINQSTP